MESNQEGKTGAQARREFLSRSALAAGSAVIGLTGVARAADAGAAAEPEMVLRLDANQKLAPVGGSEVIDTAEGRLIVAHPDAETFAACSAICPHRGCEVGYNAADKQFVCPCHGSRFALDGSLVKGPAKSGLKSYAAQGAAVIRLKP